MAVTVQTPAIGQYVYRTGTPQVPGKILGSKSDQLPHRTRTTAHVLWINGEESHIDVMFLRDFQGLIADHEKKIKTHRAKLAVLEKM